MFALLLLTVPTIAYAQTTVHGAVVDQQTGTPITGVLDRVPVTFDNSTYVKGYSLLGAKLGFRRNVTPRWQLNVVAGGRNLLGSTYPAFLFVGPNYKGLAQAADGGTGDGYIIPAPYDATLYGSVTLSYVL